MKENSISLSLKTINVQYDMCANWIEQRTNEIIQHDQFDYILGVKEQVYICKLGNVTQYINWCMDRNYTIITMKFKKYLWQISRSFMIISLGWVARKETYLNIINAMYDKYIGNIRNEEILKMFTLKLGRQCLILEQSMSLLARAIEQRKQKKCI